MSMASKLKDVVLDRFGVLDDVDDYLAQIARSAKEFERKAAVFQRLSEKLQTKTQYATQLDQLDTKEYRELRSVFEDTLKDVSDIETATDRLALKARKDPAIWKHVQGVVEQAQRKREELVEGFRQIRKNLAVLEAQQRDVLRLAQGRHELDTGRLSETLGRVVGLIVAAITVSRYFTAVYR